VRSFVFPLCFLQEDFVLFVLLDYIATLMKARCFFLLSLALAILALSAQFWAMGFTSRSLDMRARAIARPPEIRAQYIAQAKAYRRQAPMFLYSGLALAIGSLVVLIASFRRHESAWHSIPIGLLSSYLLSFFFLI
jgi:hypothetical protein